MRCPTCSRELDGAARFCDACGRLVRLTPAPTPARRRRWAFPLLIGLVVVAAAFGIRHWTAEVEATPELLQAAMASLLEGGQTPGMDPICVANGLAYDNDPVNVQLDNTATLSWMNLLVDAGLYARPESGSSGGVSPQPISIYRPLPELAKWGGGRRLCVAGGVRLDGVTNLGPIEDMRLRGRNYTGVLADVRWTLQDPAPWLARPGVGEAFARQLPSWRGARWQPDPHEWTLVQRKSFVLVDKRWTAGDAVERPAASVRSGTAAL
ncbi:MAG: zinc ribbon domain-containing protein [Burkholderiaceae bacterium]